MAQRDRTAAHTTSPARWRADLRDAWVLTRTDVRCKLRHLRGNVRRLLGIGFAVVTFGVLFPLGLSPFAYWYGADVVSGAVPVGETGVAFGALAGAGLYLGGVSGYSQESAGSVGPLVRTSMPPRAVAIGRLATELVMANAVLVVASGTLLAAVAVGAGSLLPPVLLTVGAVPVLLPALAVGRLAGTGLRAANRYLGLSLWTKVVLWLGFAVAIYVLTFQVLFAGVEDGATPWSTIPQAFLPGTSLQAYASVVLAPIGGAPRALGLVVAGSLLTVAFLAFALAVRIEARLLQFEGAAEREGRAAPGRDEPEGAGATGHESQSVAAAEDRPAAVATSRGVPRPFSAVPSGRVAWRYLLRTRRDPRTLAHLTPLLFGVLGLFGTAIQDPHLLLTLGQPAAVVGGGTLAGAAYCLNPMGDDRDQLPLLFTSVPTAALLVRGRVLAGLTLGLPLAVGLGFVLGIASGTSPVVVTAASVFAVGFALAGAGTALGVGAVVPRFDRREYMSVERAHPSTLALFGFAFGGLVVGAIGLLLVVVTVDGGHQLAVLVGWLLYVAVVGTVGVGGYVYAVRRFDRLTLDEI